MSNYMYFALSAIVFIFAMMAFAWVVGYEFGAYSILAMAIIFGGISTLVKVISGRAKS